MQFLEALRCGPDAILCHAAVNVPKQAGHIVRLGRGADV